MGCGSSDRSLGVSPAIAKKGKGGRKAANPEMTDEERRQERILKNRVSAMKSLQKKKRYTDDLEQRAKFLSSQNHELKTKIYGLLARLNASGYSLASPYDPHDAYYASNADHLLHQLLANFRYSAAFQHAPHHHAFAPHMPLPHAPHPAHPAHALAHQHAAPPPRPRPARPAPCTPPASHLPPAAGPVARPTPSCTPQSAPPPPPLPSPIPAPLPRAELDAAAVDRIGESFLADAPLAVDFEVPEL